MKPAVDEKGFVFCSLRSPSKPRTVKAQQPMSWGKARAHAATLSEMWGCDVYFYVGPNYKTPSYYIRGVG